MLVTILRKFTVTILSTALVVSNLFTPLSFGFFFATPVAEAAINRQINYQGRLLDSSGNAVSDANYNIQFKLYTASTGGSAIWTETHCYSPDSGATCNGTGSDERIATNDGLFSVMLGSVNALDDIDFNQTLYLGVNIGGSATTPSYDGEMSPRKVLGAVPAAFEADRLDGLESGQFLRNDIVNATSTATTSLSVRQNGAGNVAEFLGSNGTGLIIDTNGNVGVGTSTPAANLHIYQDSPTADQILFRVGTSDNSNRFSVDEDGDVNFGIKGSANSSRISLEGDGTDHGYINLRGSETAFGSYGLEYYSSLDATNLYTYDGRNLSLGEWSFGKGTYTSNLFIEGSTGNVGIGTTSPYAKLSVVGETVSEFFTATSTTASSTFPLLDVTDINIAGKLYDGNASAGTNGYVLQTTGSGTEWVATSSLGISSPWTTSGSDIYYSAGNVGVGTTTPVASLGISTSTSAAGANIKGVYSDVYISGDSGYAYGAYFDVTESAIASSIYGVYAKASSNGDPNGVYGVYGETPSNNGIGVFGTGHTGVSGSSNHASGKAVYASQSNASGFSLYALGGKNYIQNNLGIGTTSPYAKLSVVGETVSEFFTATSTTASSTFPLLDVTDINIAGKLYDGNASAGTNGYVLQTTGSGTEWVATSSLGIGGGGMAIGDAVTSGTEGSVLFVDASGNLAQNNSDFYWDDARSMLKVASSSTGAVVIGQLDQTVARGTNAVEIVSDAFNTNQVASGNVSIAIGYRVQASGLQATAIGQSTTASGQSSVALGSTAAATADYTVSIGYSNAVSGTSGIGIGNDNDISGDYATAVGYSNGGSSDYTTAFGYNNTVGALRATALGYANNASGGSASAIGYQNSAQSTWNAAFGYNNTANAALAVAFGSRNTASGDSAAAFGYENTASGQDSSAFGYKTQATAAGASVFGGGGVDSALVNSTADSTLLGPQQGATIHILSTGEVKLPYFTATSTTASSTAPLFDVTDIDIAGKLYDSNASAGTNGYVLQTTGSGVEWVATSSLGISGGGGGMAIGDAVTSGTAGSVLFVDGSGNLAQDNSNFYWDDSSNYLGIGQSSPESKLDITTNSLGATQTNTSGIVLANNTAATGGVTEQISPAIRWRANGYAQTGPGSNGSRPLDFRSFVVPGTAQGLTTGYLTFQSSYDGGNYTDSLSITHYGRIGIGDTSPSFKLDVAGTGRFTGALQLDGGLKDDSASFGTNGYVLQTNGAGAVNWVSTSSLGITGGGGSSLWTQNGSDIYYNTGNVGIGTTTPYAALGVAGEIVMDSFNATSTAATSTIAGNLNVQDTLQVGTSSLYLTKDLINFTNAVQIGSSDANPEVIVGNISGNVRGTEAIDIQTSRVSVTDVASGVNSIAIGGDSTASGLRSIAIGFTADATAGDAMAIGYSSLANQSNATAVGYNSHSQGLRASSFGYGNGATGADSTAVGRSSSATASFASSFGYNNIAIGSYAYSAGASNQAGEYATAVGYSNDATGQYAVALGYNNTGGGDNIYANAVAVGNSNDALASQAIAVGFSNQSSATDAIAVGAQNNVSATEAVAMGLNNTAGGGNGTAFGAYNNASGSYSIAFGYGNSAASTRASSVGYSNYANQLYASALGYDNDARAGRSTSVGYSNYINTGADYASAFGADNDVQTNSDYATAVGYSNYINSTALRSNAFGYDNTINSNVDDAYVFGDTNTANADGVGIIGANLTNSVANSLMLGPSQGNTIHILSDGEVQLPFLTSTSTATSTFNGPLLINADSSTGAHASSSLIVGSKNDSTTALTINSGSGSAGTLAFYESSTSLFEIAADGPSDTLYVVDGDASHGVYLGQNASSWSGFSDRRLKENIEEYSVLDRITNFRAVSYDWKNSGQHDLGVVAQELVTSFPELVNRGSDGRLNGTSVMQPGVWAVMYDKMGALALQGLRELYDRVVALEARVDQLANSSYTAAVGAFQNLTVGSSAKPGGITIFDEETGAPYCLTVRGGSVVTRSGDCSTDPDKATFVKEVHVLDEDEAVDADESPEGNSGGTASSSESTDGDVSLGTTTATSSTDTTATSSEQTTDTPDPEPTPAPTPEPTETEAQSETPDSEPTPEPTPQPEEPAVEETEPNSEPVATTPEPKPEPAPTQTETAPATTEAATE